MTKPSRSRDRSSNPHQSPNPPALPRMALPNPPMGLHWRSSTLFIITTVGVGIFTDLFLYALIVPILPFILKDRVGVPQSSIQTYTSTLLAAFAAASFCFSPVAGWLADKIEGRQKPFLAGLAALAVSTVLLAFGRTVAELAIARALQGASSAVVWTLGLAICLETVGPANLGTTIGSVSSSGV
jgi:MFS family permease